MPTVPSYSYTPGQRLASRTWARGITTSYGYDHAGGLLSVSYNDSVTPNITNGYDRRGRQTNITQTYPDTSTVVCAMTYNDQNQLLTESYSGGPLDGTSITNGYDSLLRRTNLVARNTGVLTTTLYGYDAASRLHSVSDGTNSAAYSYLANSSLVSNIVFQQSGATRMTTVKAYDNLNRLTSIYSVNASPAVLDSHGYAYNAANQRASVTNTDGTYWVYQYDSLGQVISGVKYWSNGTPVAGQQFGYSFDTIGNRTATTAGGDQWGRNLRYVTYGANTLNQYTNRTVPGAVDIIGSATNTATVTVNNLTTYRHGSYYRAELGLNNSTGPVWQSVTNLGILNQGTNDTIQTNITGNVYLPQTTEYFGYDADGNLTNDGRWIYTWDGENRLVSMTNNANVPTGAQMQLNFTYDDKGRRISKNVVTNGVAITLNYIYDRWNLMVSLNSGTNTAAYAWGSDISNSSQGAGGVGGLLFQNEPGTHSSFFTYDGSGNVSTLVDASTSAASAQYEYGPFGEVIRASGWNAKSNPFRFSTKYQDDESDLLYYGYRYLKSSTGNWLSRDPQGEQGGPNLYNFVLNSPINLQDANGLSWHFSWGIVASGQLEYDICQGKLSYDGWIWMGVGYEKSGTGGKPGSWIGGSFFFEGHTDLLDGGPHAKCGKCCCSDTGSSGYSLAGGALGFLTELGGLGTKSGGIVITSDGCGVDAEGLFFINLLTYFPVTGPLTTFVKATGAKLETGVQVNADIHFCKDRAGDIVVDSAKVGGGVYIEIGNPPGGPGSPPKH